MEFPQLQSLWSEVEKARGEEVVFLNIDKGDSAEVVRKFWKEKGYSMRAVLQDGTAASDEFGVVGYPTLYLLDPDGIITYGANEFDEGKLRKLLLN